MTNLAGIILTMMEKFKVLLQVETWISGVKMDIFKLT